jgi:hypothetical protein
MIWPQVPESQRHQLIILVVYLSTADNSIGPKTR